MYDVIVVGGGVGGGAAAIKLAAQGLQVALLEAGRTPRHKMCGEFLSPEAIPILQRLEVWDSITRLNPAPMNGVRLTAMSGILLESSLPQGAIGVSRYRLDALLLEHGAKVGVDVRTQCAVSGIQGTFEDGFRVLMGHGEELQTRVVIGAWGKRATLDRTMGRRFFGKPAPFLALKRHIRGIEPNGWVELHGFNGGYCGVNGVEDGVVNVCLLTSIQAWERSGKNVDAFWQMIQQENSRLAERLQGAEAVSEDIVISNISFATRGAVEHDILMVGDSAALISPLAGNGQAMALQAAELASDMAGVYCAGAITATDLREGYRRRWQGLFSERLRLGRLLQPLFLNPNALNIGLRVGRWLPALVQWMVAGTRERQVG